VSVENVDPRTKPCTTCSKPIIFLPTPNGKSMPVDADTVAPEHERYIAGTHTSHIATCENAAYHRKRR
jgi:hypothetical protein